MPKIAVGPGARDTPGPMDETVMRAYQHHTWSWDIHGLSLHSYTRRAMAPGVRLRWGIWRNGVQPRF